MNIISLDRVSRTTEILFGLIMVLTFTCSLNVATAARADVRELLIAALGCNIAWGVIDAFFYLLSTAATRGRELLLLKNLKDSNDQTAVRELFNDVIPEIISNHLPPESFNRLRTQLLQNPQVTPPLLLNLTDLLAALLIFALVFISTFPVAIPFILLQETQVALRISNLIALLLLFAMGYSLGKYAGRRPWIWGLGLVIIGSCLVAITIALGG